jgi:hypothetical protein
MMSEIFAQGDLLLERVSDVWIDTCEVTPAMFTKRT